MKKVYLVFGLLLVAGIVMLINAASDVSTYGSFKDANQSGAKVKIVGKLSKDKDITYDPSKDANYFSFYITDNNGDESKVVLHSAKPQDFELSESIVVTGKMKGDVFEASDMLLKCPSKYKDEEIEVKSKL